MYSEIYIRGCSNGPGHANEEELELEELEELELEELESIELEELEKLEKLELDELELEELELFDELDIIKPTFYFYELLYYSQTNTTIP